jgi:xanthosine utilization system XapX-like protein
VSTALLPSTVLLALVGDVIFALLPIRASDNPHVSLCCILGWLVGFLGWDLSEAVNIGDEGHVQGREKNCCPASDGLVLQEIPSLAWSCRA